jgi:F-type H+-transporting ATPase subunit b
MEKLPKTNKTEYLEKRFSRRPYFWLPMLLVLFQVEVAHAASDAPMFSLANTDFVVAIAFALFIGVLIYFRVPKIIGELLDKRAASIKGEIDEAHRLLEEAKSLLAKLEREHKENITKAKEIIEDAELSSKKILEESKSEIKLAVSRKLKLAERQIQANEKDLINAIKVDLIDEAFKLAQEQIENKVNLEVANLIAEESLSEIEIKLS